MTNINRYSFQEIKKLSIESGFFRIKSIEQKENFFLEKYNLIIDESKVFPIEIYKLTTIEDKIIYVVGKSGQFIDFVKKYEISYFDDSVIRDRIKGDSSYMMDNNSYGGLYLELLEGVYIELKYAILQDGNMLAHIENISVIFGNMVEVKGHIVAYQNLEYESQEFVEILLDIDNDNIEKVRNYNFITKSEDADSYYKVCIKKAFVPDNYKFIPGIELVLKMSEYSNYPLYCNTIFDIVKGSKIVKISKIEGFVEFEVLTTENDKLSIQINETDFSLALLINNEVSLDIYPQFNEVVFNLLNKTPFEVSYKEYKELTINNSVYFKAIIKRIIS